MSLNRKSRIRQLEKSIENLPPPPCPECAGVIKLITVCQGGFYLYEGCEPCSVCDARSAEHGEEPGENGRCSASESFGDPSRRPITRLYYACPEAPPAIPALEDLGPGDVLQAPDGATYRRTESEV